MVPYKYFNGALPAGPDRVRLDGTDRVYGDFRDDLVRDGYAVVKGAIPRARAEKYAEEMYGWLEEFDLGFKRDDFSTVHYNNLPFITEKGMCLHYAVTHEDFVWKVRWYDQFGVETNCSEPGVVGSFEKVYDTPDLIVSFDAVNFGFPKYHPPEGPTNL
jgi:hypothetical protein